ncbi:MAG: helix-turn-helix domain-containing protein [Planctomycetota bacterium]|jgi:transcriptional regulator with XRE-family HTH domain
MSKLPICRAEGGGVRARRNYTCIGRRIAEVGKRQRDIARVLGVTQQTVSKKLCGATVILLSDLEKLSAHYRIPLTYFFEETARSSELSLAIARIDRGSDALQRLAIRLSRIPEDLTRPIEKYLHSLTTR